MSWRRNLDRARAAHCQSASQWSQQIQYVETPSARHASPKHAQMVQGTGRGGQSMPIALIRSAALPVAYSAAM